MSLVSENGEFGVQRRVWGDPDIHAQELAKIFKVCWQFVGHESEIREPGDYVTRRVGQDRVIVTRDETGQVRVLLNTCRHRGTPLCRADQGNASHFRCSYHGWTYANTGELRGVTFQRDVYGKGFDKSQYGLIQPARVESYLGLIFVNWDGSAPDLQEYLGPMAWYLHAVFGKFGDGLEVAGSPVRTLVRANWKPEGENLSGDGYHTPITHGTAFELGLFADQQDLAAMAEVSGRRPTGRTVDCGHGHTMRIQRMPLAVERPSYFGYPAELWGGFDERLDAGQREVMSCLSVGHGTVFPNMSYLENFKTNVDGRGRHARYIRITLRYPTGPDSTEEVWFLLQPKSAPAEWRRRSTLAYLRTNGPAGMFEVDDTENFVGITEASHGAVAQDLPIVLEGGKEHPPADPALGWPGDVAEGDRTEKTIRAFHRRWQQLLNQPAPAGRPREEVAL